MTGLVDPQGRPLAPAATATPHARQALGFGGRAFVGASSADPDTMYWTPRNYSGRAALEADREPLVARIHDLARNDGWTSGGLTKFVDNLVGASWRLQSLPNARTLGIDPKAARELAKDIEALWADDAEDPDCWLDYRRTLSFAGLVALAMRHRMMDGEAFGVVMFDQERRGPFATCLQTIDPDRVSDPNGRRDPERRIVQGVELDKRGAPVAYHVRVAHPGDDALSLRTGYRWERVAREVPGVRRQVVHAFEPNRADDVRGTPVLASVVKKIRMLGRYDETEAQAALLNALMAAFVESPFDQEQLAESMGDAAGLTAYQEERLGFHGEHPLKMQGVKVNFMFPGEKVTLTSPHHPNAVYEPFVRSGLRNVAAAMGLTYEQLSADWGNVNYSSARAALIDVAKGFTARKGHFAFGYVQPFFSAWLGEQFARGRLKLPNGAPDFWDAKAAYCAANWIGPGRGWVDPLKEAQAAEKRLELGISTRRREAAEQGDDFDDIVAEAAREREEMLAAGLNPDLPRAQAAQVQQQQADDAAARAAEEREANP